MILKTNPHRYLHVECLDCTATQAVHLHVLRLGAKVISRYQTDPDILLEFPLKSVSQLIS
jgi:hypothetical protein